MNENSRLDEALLTLTATELAVLEGVHLEQVLDLPPGQVTEARLDDTHRARHQEAVRSLTARGLLTPDGRLHDLTVAGLVAELVLDVRLAASSLVVAERLLGEELPGERPQQAAEEPRAATAAGRRDLRMLHLADLGGVLEDLHPGGLHSLELLVDPGHLVQAVTDFLVPPDAVAGTGPARLAEPGRADTLPQLLGSPTVLGQLTLADQDGPAGWSEHVAGLGATPPPPELVVESYLVSLGPGGCFAADLSREGQLAHVPIEPGWVHRTVDGWVARTVESADAEEDTAQ